MAAQSGQAEEFIPSVNVQCVGSTMTIRVDTSEPFYGVIHGINREEPGCSVLGQGGRKTKLSIDLSIPAGAPGSCGVKYNPVGLSLSHLLQFCTHLLLGISRPQMRGRFP